MKLNLCDEVYVKSLKRCPYKGNKYLHHIHQSLSLKPPLGESSVHTRSNNTSQITI